MIDNAQPYLPKHLSPDYQNTNEYEEAWGHVLSFVKQYTRRYVKNLSDYYLDDYQQGVVYAMLLELRNSPQAYDNKDWDSMAKILSQRMRWISYKFLEKYYNEDITLDGSGDYDASEIIEHIIDTQSGADITRGTDAVGHRIALADIVLHVQRMNNTDGQRWLTWYKFYNEPRGFEIALSQESITRTQMCRSLNFVNKELRRRFGDDLYSYRSL